MLMQAQQGRALVVDPHVHVLMRIGVFAIICMCVHVHVCCATWQLKEILCAFGPLKAFRMEEDRSTRPWKVYAFAEVRIL